MYACMYSQPSVGIMQVLQKTDYVKIKVNKFDLPQPQLYLRWVLVLFALRKTVSKLMKKTNNKKQGLL